MKKFLVVIAAMLCAGGCRHEAAPPVDASREAGEIRRGVAMGASREERQKRMYESIVRKIEPSGVGKRDRLPVYVEFFKREFIEDPRQFAFDVRAKKNTLVGYVEFPEHKAAMAELLKFMKLTNVADRIHLAPAESLGENNLGIISADTCFAIDRAEGKGETLTTCLKGEPVFILNDPGTGRLWCHVSDGYVGYLDASNIERVDGATFDKRIGSGEANPLLEKAIDSAMKMIGTKYVWGGTTREGIDCSGLVFNAFESIGINLPRDADQQSLCGRLVAMRWHRGAMRRGDLLYFIGRRGTIHHTAIYLGKDQFIEAADDGVKISSFNKNDSNFAEKRDSSFCFAKRLLD